jgi:hypothetical protein
MNIYVGNLPFTITEDKLKGTHGFYSTRGSRWRTVELAFELYAELRRHPLPSPH